MPLNTLFSHQCTETEADVMQTSNSLWEHCDVAAIDRYWNGKSPLRDQGTNWKNLTQVASVWNELAVYFYFQCFFDQLRVDPDLKTSEQASGLWEKDEVQLLIEPESCDDYYQIEVSPLGQWLDAHVIRPRMDVDYRWRSGAKIKSVVDEQKKIWHLLLGIPFQPVLEHCAVWRTPEVGRAWRLNLFRIAGEEPRREYLAWRPTFTGLPDFHVPSAFGNLIFVDG
jgi:hypothetical protein